MDRGLLSALVVAGPGLRHKGPERGGRLLSSAPTTVMLEAWEPLQPCMLKQPMTKTGREEGLGLGQG